MDPTKMLQDLIEQRRLIDATIGTVERLVVAARRKGRPPKAVTEARDILGKQSARKRKRGSWRDPAGGSPVARIDRNAAVRQSGAKMLP
jgi:hypothetical protein